MHLNSEVLVARDEWVSAVDTLDVDWVVSLYHPEWGRLLGTVDDDQIGIRSTPDAMRAYFKDFLNRKAVRPNFHTNPTEVSVVTLSNTACAYSGYYDIELTDQDDSVTIAHAKFTFVYELTDQGLLIVLHNSGLTPAGMQSV